MGTWKAFRVSEIISEIGNEKFVLPVIQRRLVWEEDDMELLFDTLLKGDSFGGVMVIEEEKETEPLFMYRPFTLDGEPIKSRKGYEKLPNNQYFVIDGQQRLQSFYIGIKGSVNGNVMFFDLFSDYKNSEYYFQFLNDVTKLPKEIKKNADIRPIKTHSWVLVRDLFEKLKESNKPIPVANSYIKSKNITDENERDHIINNVNEFYNSIFGAESVGVSKVYIDKSLPTLHNRQRIVEMFRRLNAEGTKLSTSDLVASILKGFDPEMETFLETTVKQYADIGLNQENENSQEWF